MEENNLPDLTELDISDIPCVKCNTFMKVYPEGTSPDDYTAWLICPNCFHTEKE